MALRSLALLVMLTVPGLVFAREPPPPHMPIGMRLDGSLSDELFLSLTKRWHNIALRVPPLKGYRAHEQYPTFDLSFRDALDRPVFRLNFVGRPDGNALSSRSQFMYRLSQSEVMPIFDELYLIGVLPPTAVRLNRVTVRVAEKYRPAVACRTIPMNSGSSGESVPCTTRRRTTRLRRGIF
jgi:hypothetical protein